MMRRFAQADEILLESDQPLSSLAWRPDGSLLTFFRHEEEKLALHMLILSDPPLLRRLTLSLGARLPTDMERNLVEQDGLDAMNGILDRLMTEHAFYDRLKALVAST